VNYAGTTYNVPDNVNNALKTIEQILNGTMKMDGNGADDYTEYKIDLSGNKCYISNPAQLNTSYINSVPKSVVKLSYNDTIQAIYAFTKTAVAATASPPQQLDNAKPYIVIYSAFISKLNKNIDIVLNNTSADGKKLLMLILAANSFSFIEEKTVTIAPVMPGARTTDGLTYNVGFEETILMMHHCFHAIFTRSAIGQGLDYLFCNYSEIKRTEGEQQPVSILQKNYNTLNLNFKRLKSGNFIKVTNPPERTLPLFVELIANYTNPGNDIKDNIFSAYNLSSSIVISSLTSYLQTPNSSSTPMPTWFSPQNPSTAIITSTN
jgi:hypothetical protein